MESENHQEIIKFDEHLRFLFLTSVNLALAFLCFPISPWLTACFLVLAAILFFAYRRGIFEITFIHGENKICKVRKGQRSECIDLSTGGALALTTLNRHWTYLISAENGNKKLFLYSSSDYKKATALIEKLSLLTKIKPSIDEPIFPIFKISNK